jgi:hypothetical protein
MTNFKSSQGFMSAHLSHERTSDPAEHIVKSEGAILTPLEAAKKSGINACFVSYLQFSGTNCLKIPGNSLIFDSSGNVSTAVLNLRR